MHPRQRTRFVDELIRELGLATSDFEQIGYCFMNKFHPASWDHRGTNVVGFPVKSVVDSVGRGVHKAAQYNSEQTFFSDRRNKKLIEDVDGIFDKHPSVEEAWLLSNRVATGGDMTRALQVATKGRTATIEILDARRIADFIVDQFADRKFIDSLAVHLPFLLKLENAWALSHRPPQVEGYVTRLADETAVKKALRAKRIVTITGASGLGKSALADKVADQLYAEDDYDLVLWQDGRKLERVQDLHAVDVEGYGRRENLLGYLKTQKCLLVVDNLVVDDLLRAILDRSGPGTRILATSQTDTGGGEIYRLGEVDEATARAILTRGLGPCSDEVFAAAYSAIGGHPLLLTILRNDVAKAAGDWSRISGLCAAPHTLVDDRRQKVCERILEQHKKALATEFAFISWCNSPIIDGALLAEACGPMSEEQLQARRFATPNADGTVRLNDLTLRSIRTVGRHSSADADTFLESLTRLVERVANARGERLVLLRIARIHREHVRSLITGTAPASARQRAAMRFLYASCWNGRADLGPLGDPVQEAQDLHRDGNADGSDIRVRAIVETIEKTYWHALREGKKQARQRLEALLPAFDHLNQNQELSRELLEDIAFHQAKAWSWCGKTNDAETAFRKLLVGKPGEAATHLQLGKLHGGRALGKPGPDADATIVAFSSIVVLPPESVATTVTLDGFGLLALVGHESALPLLIQHRDRLLQELRSALSKGLAQPYSIVAKLMGAFWFHAGDALDSVFATIAGRPAPMESDDDIFAWAQAQKQYAKNLLDRDHDVENVRSLLQGAIAAYEQIEKLVWRQPVQFAEALLLTAQHARALAVLDAEGVERSCHWFHRRAQALRGLNQLTDALNDIDAALANAEQKFKAAFLEERYEIRRRAGDAGATSDLERAHDECAPGKYKDELRRRREGGTASSQVPAPG